MRLKDKVTIATGGGYGIGRAYSLGLAKEGARVVIADINYPAAQRTAKEIMDKGGQALAVETDISNEESVRNMVERTIKEFGRIDILVNNAALFTALKPKPWDQIDAEEWDRVMAVNVRGTFLCCRAVFPYMKQRGKGKIINISSSTVWFGATLMLHYVTSKAAIIGLTSSEGVEATEWNRRTEMRAKERCIKRKEYPEDLVGTIIFLASEDSDFITGQTINVDGGATMH